MKLVLKKPAKEGDWENCNVVLCGSLCISFGCKEGWKEDALGRGGPLDHIECCYLWVCEEGGT